MTHEKELIELGQRIVDELGWSPKSKLTVKWRPEGVPDVTATTTGDQLAHELARAYVLGEDGFVGGSVDECCGWCQIHDWGLAHEPEGVYLHIADRIFFGKTAVHAVLEALAAVAKA